jgi:UDP-N-acetylmuramate--alanine ligase
MSYHFIGIGGIGMSSLAKILLERKRRVQGSDIKESNILEELKKKGAKITIGHKKENIKGAKTVIYSSAIGNDNEEVKIAKKRGFKFLHRSKLLKVLMKGYKPLLVTGMHGKTTTTSLLTQVFIDAKEDPSYSIGGILNSKNSNGGHGSGKYFVLEADESDGSFLNYDGYGAIITNVEREHLDYWKNIENIERGFLKFIGKIENKNLIFWCYEDEILRRINKAGISYGFSKKADITAFNIREKGFFSVFDISFKGKVYKNVKLSLFGKHNILNSLAVFGLSISLGIREEKIKKTFFSFLGVKRRMEKIGEKQEILFFDDYAHHPTEIERSLRALRLAVKEKRIVGIFQPHRYSRVKSLFKEFTNCFDFLDHLIVLDIYSASEKRIRGITSKKLVKNIKKSCEYVSKKNLFSKLLKLLKPHDIVLFLGAGNISDMGRELVENFKKVFSKKIKLALFFGGRSDEHLISVLSCKNIYRNLDKNIYDISLFYITKEGIFKEMDENFKVIKGKCEILKKLKTFDVCFPLLHGTYGEDGMIQGFFETLNIPYVGCDYRASAFSMNKTWVKCLANKHNILTGKFFEVHKAAFEEDRDKVIKRIKEELKFPVFVKPNHLGSSIGVVKVESKKFFEKALEENFKLDSSVIVEEEMRGQEIEFGLIGNDFVEVALPGEILSDGEVYDFERKYGKDASGIGAVKVAIPAKISKEKIEEGKKIAKKVYKIIGCSGFARIDFFFKGGKFYLNEINPIPGCTGTSLYPKMLEASGISYKEWLNGLIILAMQRSRKSYEKKF